MSVSWTINKLRNLGRLVDYSDGNDDDLFDLQQFLDRFDPDEGMGVNNVQKTMEMVCIICNLFYSPS